MSDTESVLPSGSESADPPVPREPVEVEALAGGDAAVEIDASVPADARPDDETPEESRDGSVAFVVGLGASAGGLRPLQEFFAAMPTDSGAAFVVVQHLSPDFKSLMPELIGRQTEMPAVRIEHGMEPEPDTIYLNTPRTDVSIVDGRFHLIERERDHDAKPHFPIDRFFSSLSGEMHERSIGIILSGTGSDGSRGIRAINESGGVVLVQDPSSCQFDGMPQASITTGHADCVQRPAELARTVYEYVRAAGRGFPRRDRETTGTDAELIDRIIGELERSEKIDFSHYKRTTIGRRIERRRLLGGCASLAAYFDLVEDSAEEREALRSDLLITVTSFFRDPEAWNVITQKAIPELLDSLPPGRPLRAWVPACATGEEAYSLAMTLIEAMEARNDVRDLKIFATDIDDHALERAALGVYPRAIVGDVPEDQLRRFFVWKDGRYEVARELREKIIFAPQNLAQDAPFTRMDLVSCRNVLIYMESQLQQHVLRMLHFALNVRGVLFMGAADVVGQLQSEFEIIDGRWKLFQKRRDVRLTAGIGDRFIPGAARARIAGPPGERVRVGTSARRDAVMLEALGRLLEERGGVCLIIGDHNELLRAYGQTDRYLRVPKGQTSNDVTRLVPKAVQLALHTAVHRIRNDAEHRPAVFGGLHCEIEGELCTLRLRVERIDARLDTASDELLLVMIDQEREAGVASAGVPSDLDEQAQVRIRDLESELAQTRENLQATIEELESTNEEQQAGNEELLASNEELQSTNEELHSLNEELYTVNSEYQAKIQELTELHHDMDNLLMSTNIGTIFLDGDLRVRKFTPAATEAFNLVEVDVGRPIEHLSHNLEYAHLFDDIRTVMASGRSIERDSRTKRGRPLLVRVNPYRTEQSRHQGVVLTFIDIGELKQAESDLRARAEELARANAELDRFNRLAIGREERILDLKSEINDLAAAHGAEPPYDLSFLGGESGGPAPTDDEAPQSDRVDG